MKLSEILRKKTVILDGAMGTMLQARGVDTRRHPELTCRTDGEAVERIHRDYAVAGSDIIYANTFAINGHRTGNVAELIKQAIEVAARAGVPVGLDMSPIGELLYPYGSMEENEAYELYREIAMAGEAAGADLAALETFSDTSEIEIALRAVKENTALPVFATMTFDKKGYTFTGARAGDMARILEKGGAEALGINCSVGPDELYDTAKELRDACKVLPLIVKPNAGLPNPKTGKYGLEPEHFAELMAPYVHELGYKFIGGCCGTTPEHIAALKNI